MLLVTRIPFSKLDHLVCCVNSNCRKIHMELTIRKNHELRNLSDHVSSTAANYFPQNSFSDRVINLSDVKLDDDKLSFLSHGLKHALSPPKVNVQNLKTTIVADIMAGIRDDEEIDIPGLSDILEHQFYLPQMTSKIRSQHTSLMKKIQQENLRSSQKQIRVVLLLF